MHKNYRYRICVCLNKCLNLTKEIWNYCGHFGEVKSRWAYPLIRYIEKQEFQTSLEQWNVCFDWWAEATKTNWVKNCPLRFLTKSKQKHSESCLHKYYSKALVMLLENLNFYYHHQKHNLGSNVHFINQWILCYGLSHNYNFLTTTIIFLFLSCLYVSIHPYTHYRCVCVLISR